LPHEVEVVDDLTARLRGEQPFGPLLNLLAVTYIVSAEDVGKGLDALEKAPNGTGPYRLSEDEPNRKSFVPFDGYFADASGPDELVMEYVPDPQTRLNALLSRQAEIIDRVQPDQAAAIERRDDVKLLASTASETQSFSFRMDKEPFGNNERLRKAFAWGVDREGIVELVGGKAQLADSNFSPGVYFREPQEPIYTFDPERARAEVEAAGVTTPVPFEMLVATGLLPKAEEACELAVENLREVGFDPKLTPLSLAAWSDALLGEAKRGEVFYGGAAAIYPDPDIQLFGFVKGAAYDAQSERVYDLIEAGRTTLNQDERARIYAELQRYLWDYLPRLPVLYSDYSQGLQQYVAGYELPINSIPSFVQVRLEGTS
jgi:peptide/nickel transport system substrate-binding protein